MSASPSPRPPASASHPGRRGLWLGLAAVGVLLLAGLGWRWWQGQARQAALVAALPARPDVSPFAPEFGDRLADAERAVRSGHEVVASFGELAMLYHASGFYPEAMQAYRALVRADPANPVWPHRLAGLYAGYGELATAIPLWERALARRPDYLPARIHLGDAYLKMNRPAEATREFLAVLQRDADNPYALTSLARLDYASHALAQARERLERATQASHYAIGFDLLTTVYEELGQNDQAIALRARTKSSGAYFDPPDPWTDVIFNDCYDTYRLSVAAGVAEHSGDTQTAFRLLERAIHLAPGNALLPLQAGMIAMRTQDGALAKQYLEHASKIDPTNSDVWAQLIELYTGMGDTAAANHALGTGLTYCPNSPGLRLQFARRLASAGRTDEAIAQFNETFRLRPSEADPLIEIATIYFQQERYADAVAELQRALGSEPEHPVALSTLALFAISTGDEPAAREWLRRCTLQVRIQPEQLRQLKEKYAQHFGRVAD